MALLNALLLLALAPRGILSGRFVARRERGLPHARVVVLCEEHVVGAQLHIRNSLAASAE